MKQLIRKFTIGLLIIVYVFVFGEVFLRLFNPVPILPRYVCATEFGIRGNVPNASYWQKTAEYKVNIRTNSKGIRSDREIPYEKPSGVKRIVVLGDSFGMGYEVDLKDTFLSVMENCLQRAGKNVEVVNLSVSGHGNAEELIMLRNEGRKYSPDLVLLVWQETDLEDNIRSDLFGVDNDQLVVRSKEYLPAMKTRQYLDQFPIYRWLESESNMYCWIRESAAKMTKNLMVALKNKNNAAAASPQEASAKVSEYSKKLSYLLVRQIEMESKDHGAKMIILNVPQSNPKSGAISLLPEEIKQGFDVVSVIDDFRRFKNERLFWDKSHWHFTPFANGIVGRSLASYILKRGLI